MDQKITVITFGVKNIKRSREFYEKLGWKASLMSNDDFVAFQTNGIVFCLYPEHLLAEDAKVDSKKSGFSGVTLAHNVSNKTDVQKILNEAERAGGKITKHAQDVFWGGHSGYFTDPDGHLWEIAWNPHWIFDSNGMVQLQN